MKKNSFVLTLFAFVALFFSAASVYGEETATPAADQGVKIRVALYDGDGVGPSGKKNFPLVFESAPRFEMTKIDGKQVRDGILDNFDIFLMPGGMAGEEAASLKPEGVKKLKEFIKSGKCYIGFCAGAYFPIEQRFMDNAQLKTRNWERGGADLKIESTDLGVKIFGEQFKGTQICRYHNGPIFNVNVNPLLPPVQVLSYFRSETADWGAAPGNQINSPAIVITTYGKGTVIILSPHPETKPELHGIVLGCLNHLADNILYGQPEQSVIRTGTTPSEENLAVRQKILNYMRSMAELEWTPAEDLEWWADKNRVLYKKGETYHGIPYSREWQWSNLEDFKTYLQEQDGKLVYTGPTEYYQYKANACACACSFSWRSVCPDMPVLKTINLEPGKIYISSRVDGKTRQAFLKVGEYKMTKYDDSKAVVNDNGKDAMFACYAQLLPGDGLVKRPSGHAMMVMRVDAENQTFYIIDQYGVERGKTELVNENQSWHIEQPYTYEELFEQGYLPISPFFLND